MIELRKKNILTVHIMIIEPEIQDAVTTTTGSFLLFDNVYSSFEVIIYTETFTMNIRSKLAVDGFILTTFILVSVTGIYFRNLDHETK